MKLVKTVIKGLDGYKNKTLTIDFIAEKRVYEEEAKNFVVTRLISNIYLLNTITLIGINASGKTTTLNILSEILKVFIDNKSLNQKNKWLMMRNKNWSNFSINKNNKNKK